MRAAYPSLSANRRSWVIMGYHGTAWTSTPRCIKFVDLQFPLASAACGRMLISRQNYLFMVCSILAEERQTVCKPGSVPPKRAGMAIHLGRSLPNASRDRPERRRRGPPGDTGKPAPPAAPTWSCSRWGFPCRRRCRRRGALLPHHFTLAAHAVPGGTSPYWISETRRYLFCGTVPGVAPAGR